MKLSKKLTTVTPFSKYLAMTLFVLFPFVGFFLGIQYAKLTALPAITTFVDCKAAGYPILFSYPAQCRTPDGRIFREEVPSSPSPFTPPMHPNTQQNASSSPQQPNPGYWTPERMKSAKPL